ncbi:facilitated trehalose transporter Tret1-2 homolog [Anoplophora glabripennis]|uniref:facilitated trehalose transporter Tret1-2 homolog n=1 Tax=Anoplophora glabripennis TaxID=217634 RepID=UPI000875360F|nr:facilitated trehalose transporter Tret1-2 homolog [Anoplophora glabripennis]
MTPIRSVLEKKDGSRANQYLAGISACIALFTAGIHVGWPAPSLKIILSTEYPFRISEDEGSYIVITSCLGHIVGAMTASALADTIGRKWALLSISLPQLAALMMICTSYHTKYLLYCARIIGGISEGAVLAVLPTYMAEVAEPEIRGFLGTFMSFVFVLGVLFVNIVGSHLDIYTTALIGMIFPVLYWVVFINFPETPYYYFMKGRPEQAVKSLKILRRKNSVWKEAESLSADVDRQMSESGGYLDLFRVSSNRKAFFLVAAARIFQQLTGASAYGLYCQLLIGGSTKLSPVLGSCLLMVTQLTVICVSSLFIDKIGRKPLFTLSSGLSCLVLFIQASFSILKTYSGLDLSFMHWFPVLVMVFFVSFFTMGLGVGLNIFVSEIFSSSIKAKALSLSSIVYSFSMMASIKYYQYTADNYSLAVTFYTFAFCTLIGTFFFKFFLPETKGKTLETIQQELKGRKKKMPFRAQS